MECACMECATDVTGKFPGGRMDFKWGAFHAPLPDFGSVLEANHEEHEDVLIKGTALPAAAGRCPRIRSFSLL